MGISAYGLITKDFSYGPISSLLLGIFFAIIGIEEFKNKGKNCWECFLCQYHYYYRDGSF